MAITAEAIKRLKAQLLTSGVRQRDQALFQVVDQLIDAVTQSITGVQTLTGGGGGGGGGILAQTFTTVNNDQATLPNSRQLWPGQGINFNNQGQKLVIDAVIPFPRDGEDGEMGMIGPPGIQGIMGPIGPMGPPGFDAYLEYSEPVITIPNFYEKGLWTPEFGGSGGKSGQVYSSQYGSYTRLFNRFIFATFGVTLSTLGTLTGQVQIEGLPYPSINNSNYRSVMPVFWISFTTAFVYVQGTITGNSKVVGLFGATAATTNMAGTPLAQADLTNTSRIVGTISYEMD